MEPIIKTETNQKVDSNYWVSPVILQRAIPNKNLPTQKLNKKPLNKRLIIALVIFALAVIAGGGVGYYLNYSKKTTTVLFTTKEDILANYFNGATTGKDTNGNALNPDQRKELYNKSAESLTLYTKNNPNDVDAISNLAISYYNLGKYSQAIETYKKLIKIQPDKAIYYTNIAHAYLASGDKNLAKQNYNKSIELDPSIKINYLSLSSIYSEEGDTTKAKDFFEKGSL